MKRNPEFIYNNISQQQLVYSNQLSIKSWNDIINILKRQTNSNTTIMEMWFRWFFGPGEFLNDELTDPIPSINNNVYTNYYDYLKDKLPYMDQLIAKNKSDIASHYSEITSNISNIIDNINSITGRVAANEVSISNHTSKLAEHTATLLGHRSELNSHQATLDEHTTTLTKHTNDLTNINDTMIREDNLRLYKDFTNYSERNYLDGTEIFIVQQLNTNYRVPYKALLNLTDQTFVYPDLDSFLNNVTVRYNEDEHRTYIDYIKSFDNTKTIEHDELRLGANIYIRDINIPDYWLASKQINGKYILPEDRINFFEPYEAKTDLDDYFNKTQTIEEITRITREMLTGYLPSTQVRELINSTINTRLENYYDKPTADARTTEIVNEIVTNNLSREQIIDIVNSATNIITTPLDTAEAIINFYNNSLDGIYRVITAEYGHEFLFIDKTNSYYSRITPSGKVYAYDFENQLWNQVSGGGTGGGTGGDSTLITLENISPLFFSSSITAPTSIKFNWSSETPGSGTVYVYINDNTNPKFSKPIQQGEVTLDITQWLTEPIIYSVRIVVEDSYLNRRPLIFGITKVELSIVSPFNDKIGYSGDTTIYFTPKGEGLSKDVYIEIDDGEPTKIGTYTTSNIEYYYTLTSLGHNVYKVKLYAKATLPGNEEEGEITSNILEYNIIHYENGNSTPLISVLSKNNTTVTEGQNVVIEYIAYTATNLNTTVQRILNSEVQSTFVEDRSVQKWPISNYIIGTNTARLQAGDTIVDTVFTVNESDITVEAVPNPTLYLTSTGRDNNEPILDRQVWSYNNIHTLFNGFTWGELNGWIFDERIQDTVLKLTGNANIEIQYKPFQSDFVSTGKTIEIEFSTSNIINYDTTIIDIMEKYSDGSYRKGIIVKPTEFIFKSLENEVVTKFKEDEIIRISIVVTRKDNSMPRESLIYTFINGVISGVVNYESSDSFDQNTPTNIKIGSTECDTSIYKVRVYDTPLHYTSVLNNYIADTEDTTLKNELIIKNIPIIDDSNNVIYNELLKIMPIITITCPQLPTVKDEVKLATVKLENANGVLWEYDNVEIKVQGTSSLEYAYKNFDLKFTSALIQLYANAILEKQITIKADYASSAGVYNAGNAKIVNELYTERNPRQLEDSRVRNTIYGSPVAVFYRTSKSETAKFYYKGSLNLSKLSNALGYKTGDESWSTEDNISPLCLFKTNNFEKISSSFKTRYPKDYTNYDKLKALINWIVSCGTEQSINTGDEVLISNISEEGIAKFRDEASEHFNIHYLLMYYVYFMVNGGADSMAKNMYLTYFSTASGGKWYPQFYDIDTTFGIDNEGQLTFGYNIEPGDRVGLNYAYNGSESVLWYLVANAFKDEIKSLYQNLRSDGLLTYENMMEVLYDDGIKLYPEAIYNKDSDIKYISLYKDTGENKLDSALGSTLTHLQYWVYNRFKYLDSKWVASDFEKDAITMRSTIPDNQSFEDSSMTLTSFRDIYLQVKVGTNDYMSERATRNTPTTLVPEFSIRPNNTETSIYGASSLTSIGDLSKWYLSSINISKANKLSELIIGNSSDTYENPNLVELTLGTNELLRKIDISNCSSLAQSVNASGCYNLREFYALGTSIPSAIFSNGGELTKVYLPQTITTLSFINQKNITELEYSDANIERVRLENSESTAVNSLSIIEEMLTKGSLTHVRLIGINWELDSTEILNTIRDTIKGLNEENNVQNKSVLAGIIKINGSIYSDEIAEYQEYWGTSLVITADTIIERYSCRFLNYNGTLLQRAYASAGGNFEYTGETPVRDPIGSIAYKFTSWLLSDGRTTTENIIRGADDNITATAQFEMTQQFNVTFVDAYGSTIYTTKVSEGAYATFDTDYPLPTKPKDESKKEKYTFNDWRPSIYEPITEDTIFTPLFTITPYYYYTFKNYDDTVLDQGEVDHGKTVTYKGSTPTRPEDDNASYTFSAWSPSILNPVYEDTIYTPLFNTVQKLTVTWKNWDGTVLKTEKVAYGTNVMYTGILPTKSDDAQYMNYQFTKWKDSNNNSYDYQQSITIYTNLVLTAQFEGSLRYYNVYWYSEGNLLETDTVPYGGTAEYNGATPVHSEGYAFAGWGTTNFTITGETRFDAVFEEPTYFNIKVNTAGVTPSFHVQGAYQGYQLTVNWGDGTSDTYTLSTEAGTYKKSIGYAQTGEYVVTFPAGSDFSFSGTVPADKIFNTSSYDVFDVEVTSAVIHNNVTYASYMFMYHQKLTTVVLPKDTLRIPTAMFAYCKTLKDITLPENVTYINTNAFLDCYKLSAITIPANVTQIEQNGLSIGEAANPATITFKGLTPPTVHSSWCNRVYIKEIPVPAEAVDAYKNATNWTTFSEFVVGY